MPKPWMGARRGERVVYYTMTDDHELSRADMGRTWVMTLDGAHTLTLPEVSAKGARTTIVNAADSAGSLTVEDHGGNTLFVLAAAEYEQPQKAEGSEAGSRA